jgi:hypothetical protein
MIGATAPDTFATVTERRPARGSCGFPGMALDQAFRHICAIRVEIDPHDDPGCAR